jgi:transposase
MFEGPAKGIIPNPKDTAKINIHSIIVNISRAPLHFLKTNYKRYLETGLQQLKSSTIDPVCYA